MKWRSSKVAKRFEIHALPHFPRKQLASFIRAVFLAPQGRFSIRLCACVLACSQISFFRRFFFFILTSIVCFAWECEDLIALSCGVKVFWNFVVVFVNVAQNFYADISLSIWLLPKYIYVMKWNSMPSPFFCFFFVFFLYFTKFICYLLAWSSLRK